MKLKIQKFTVNPLQENSYVISDNSGQCVFIDPGFYYEEEKEEITGYITENNLKPVKIINTHCHFDHIMGVEFLRNHYNIPFYAHKDDIFWLEKATEQGIMFGFDIEPVKTADHLIPASGNITFGNTVLDIIHVPGHTPGHVVFYHKESSSLFAGDVLFYGSIGRTDLPGGDYATLISGIKDKLLVLPENTKVFSGHGPESTIGFEKGSNPFLT